MAGSPSRFWKSVRVWGVFLILSAACAPANPVPPTQAPTPTAEWDLPGWVLVWQDEFNQAAIDRTQWAFDIGGGGWGNSELEYYTDRTENARIEDGALVIEARAEEFLHRDYTSARLKTQGLRAFTYGRIEARMQLPYGQGIWPAFWMLGTDLIQSGWPGCGEIDIMEHIGRQPGRIYGTAHGPGYSAGGGAGGYADFEAGDLSATFHRYAIEWEPGEIRWYVDDEEFFHVTPDQVSGRWVFDHPFFIILNLAVGGNWPGAPNETTVFPQVLRVDYVRVYQQPDMAGAYQGTPGVMHLGGIAVTFRDNIDGTRQAVAEITVVDENKVPVEGAYVDGGWVGAVLRGETRGVTDASGVARLASEEITRKGDVTFCVTGVSQAIHSYDASANDRNCGKTTQP